MDAKPLAQPLIPIIPFVDEIASLPSPLGRFAQSLLPTAMSTTTSADDHQRGDAIPRLTLWQKIQITPFFMYLREHLDLLISSLALIGEICVLLCFYSPCRRAWHIPRKERSLVAPRSTYRRGAIHPRRARMDSRGAQVRARPDNGTYIRGVGAPNEGSGGAHGRTSRECKAALGRATECRPRDLVFPWCAYQRPTQASANDAGA